MKRGAPPCMFRKRFRPLSKEFDSGRFIFRRSAPTGINTDAELTADAFLANDPMAMNLVLHGLHEAVMVMAMERSGLGRRADGDDGCQGNGGSENQVFHVEPLKHLGDYAAR